LNEKNNLLLLHYKNIVIVVTLKGLVYSRAFNIEMPDITMKRILIRMAFCTVCVLSLYIHCDDDDEDEEDFNHIHTQAYYSIQQQGWNEEYKVVLSCEALPVFDDAFLRNPESLMDETFKATDRDERIVPASLNYKAGKYKEQLKLPIEGKL
jgi:hypothetical protein